MRHKIYFIILFFGVINLADCKIFAHPKSQYHTVISCKMTSGDRVILKNLQPIGNYAYLEIDGKEYLADGDKPYIEINGKTSLAFDKDETYGIVTELVLTKCIQHTLIFALSIGSPYPRGFAIQQNSSTHQYERIYFAEKALPHWLYFKKDEWGVIIPNIGYETDKKYLVYVYKRGKKQPELQENMTPMNKLPVPKKDLIRIPLPKEWQ